MRTLQKILLLSFIALASLTESKTQTIINFTEGLITGQCHQYGRQGIHTDQLAYQLYTGSLKTPSAGQVLYTDSVRGAITWKPMKANHEGKFIDESLSNGYLYLTYVSDSEKQGLLNIVGNSMVYFNGAPHAGDVYGTKWLYIPVKIKKGLNEILIRIGWYFDEISARLILPDHHVALNTEDITLPNIIIGQENNELWGALVVINASDKSLPNLSVSAVMEGKETIVELPVIASLTSRKVGFKFNASNVKEEGSYSCKVAIIENGKTIDEKFITIDAVKPVKPYSCTFTSHIDGSIQYYAVCPQNGKEMKSPALFLSVHGAGVEAIGQARAYFSKDWGVLVAPTNRRPRGFNWEDWGRTDALEVLDIAMKKFNVDPARIYLTGHSMGGHGTWYLGATYPEKWAAIGPCAAYPTLFGYGSADGQLPKTGKSDIENALLRASNGSNVFELSQNYGAFGIYIHHGDSDKVVSVDYARQMRKLLATFHKDFSYYEYPGGSHWFSNQSVDWPPMFDYFKWHTIRQDSMVNTINFSTANPSVSSSYYWASILQQTEPLTYSRINLTRDKTLKTIRGETENVSGLKLTLSGFVSGDTIKVDIDNQLVNFVVGQPNQPVYLYKKSQWVIGGLPDPANKGINRNGTFKEPFNHNMIFVYGTAGNVQENQWSYDKARFDAETWYYRGNGAVDMIADKDFDPARYPDRGIILYGNSSINDAWEKLLSDCPIQVKRGSLTVGKTQLKGNDLGAYFIWPRSDSHIASVAVISGTGLPGMNAANANQYFTGGSGFSDYMIFTAGMLKEGINGIKAAGFYTNDWKIQDSTKSNMPNTCN